MSGIYSFTMTGDTEKQLEKAIDYAMNDMHDRQKKLERWAVTNAGILVLLGPSIGGNVLHLTNVSQLLPRSTPASVASGVMAWLDGATYPDRPDCDGSVKRGFRVTNAWDRSYVILGPQEYDDHPQWVFRDLIALVLPHWTKYHK